MLLKISLPAAQTSHHPQVRPAMCLCTSHQVAGTASMRGQHACVFTYLWLSLNLHAQN